MKHKIYCILSNMFSLTISTSDTGPKLVTNISVLTSVTKPTDETKKTVIKSKKSKLFI